MAMLFSCACNSLVSCCVWRVAVSNHALSYLAAVVSYHSDLPNLRCLAVLHARQLALKFHQAG